MNAPHPHCASPGEQSHLPEYLGDRRPPPPVCEVGWVGQRSPESRISESLDSPLPYSGASNQKLAVAVGMEREFSPFSEKVRKSTEKV